jgi:hypothetical protein
MEVSAQDAVAVSVGAAIAKAAKNGARKPVVSPLNGAVLPAGGRPKGVGNKVTRTIREAVELASQPGKCHPQGLAGWLVERAQGSLGDRQIFAAMVNKAMPLQVQASVDGGIRLELGWLGGRQIGTDAAQIRQAAPQVLDLKPETDGTYRIVDQQAADPAAATAESPTRSEPAGGSETPAG